MTETSQGWSPKQIARAAGVLYLIIIVCGIWAEGFVRAPITVAGDPGATAANLLAAEGMFRLAFAAEMVMALADVGVTVLLYLLLRGVSRPLALAAAAFHLTQTAVLSANMLNGFAALMILTGNVGSAFGAAPFEAGQAHALAAFFLNLHGHGYSLALVFFGANCVLLGILIHRAAFLPSVLGWLMAAGGIVYLGTSFIRFALPGLYGAASPAFVLCLVAELALALWLVARGVDEAKWR